MVCPRCNTVNSDNAVTCKRCGQRLRRQAPSPQQSASRSAASSEKKYILVGTITLVVLILFLVGAITAFSCMCSNCAACADKADIDYINESVDGEWQGEESVSTADALIVG